VPRPHTPPRSAPPRRRPAAKLPAPPAPASVPRRRRIKESSDYGESSPRSVVFTDSRSVSALRDNGWGR
jgi:hypothetical protein